MESIFASYEAVHRARLQQDMWGHLFPKEDKYKGKIRVAKGVYGCHGTVVLDEKNLPQSSPWWYDALMDFVDKISDDMEAGEVAEFDVQVDIVDCIEELEDWQIEEEHEPDQWSEIHIKQLRKATIVKAW